MSLDIKVLKEYTKATMGILAAPLVGNLSHNIKERINNTFFIEYNYLEGSHYCTYAEDATYSSCIFNPIVYTAIGAYIVASNFPSDAIVAGITGGLTGIALGIIESYIRYKIGISEIEEYKRRFNPFALGVTYNPPKEKYPASLLGKIVSLPFEFIHYFYSEIHRIVLNKRGE